MYALRAKIVPIDVRLTVLVPITVFVNLLGSARKDRIVNDNDLV
jgi:hypothetical protein